MIDLASLESVRKGAAEILSFGQKIDVNVQNAGVMAVPEGKTVDGACPSARRPSVFDDRADT